MFSLTLEEKELRLVELCLEFAKEETKQAIDLNPSYQINLDKIQTVLDKIKKLRETDGSSKLATMVQSGQLKDEDIRCPVIENLNKDKGDDK